MRKKFILAMIVIGLLALAAGSVELGLAAKGRKSGPVFETPPPQALEHLTPHTPQSTPGSDTCGSWSYPDGAVGLFISQKYGELRNCLFFDNTWIILTLGLKEADGTHLSGIVAVYRCEPADASCLDGQTDHPVSGWQIYQPPCAGELSLGAGEIASKFRIMGTCASYFDVATGTFSK